MMREGIVVALCLGIGGYIALGIVMYALGLWPWSTTGPYGMLSGLAIYGLWASRADGLETAPAHSQLPVEGWTHHLVMNRRAP